MRLKKDSSRHNAEAIFSCVILCLEYVVSSVPMIIDYEFYSTLHCWVRSRQNDTLV